jgi:outer membrane lipoprotein SlyB
MRIARSAVVVLGLAICVVCSPLHAADARYGVVVEVKPIDNRGDDESEQVKQRRKLGSLLGKIGSLNVRLATGGKDGVVAETADIAASSGVLALGTEEAAARIGGTGPAARYMVKVRLDGGKVLSVTQPAKQLGSVKQGDRVKVEGSGDSVKISLE